MSGRWPCCECCDTADIYHPEDHDVPCQHPDHGQVPAGGAS